jgi:hypothetical protein
MNTGFAGGGVFSGRKGFRSGKIFFQKSIDPFRSPAIVSLPLTERPSRIDLKRTSSWSGIRDEKIRVRARFELKRMFESPIRILPVSVKFRTQDWK